MSMTRSKSSSAEKSAEKPSEEGLVPLHVVKELLSIQESSLKEFFATFVENTNKRIDDLIEKVSTITTSLEFTQGELKDLKAQTLSIADKTDNIDQICEKIDQLEKKTDDLENRSRRSNLCFDGILEDAKEKWEDTEKKLHNLLANTMNISTDEYTIERAHRVGRKVDGKSRPIVAKFNNYKIKEQVLKNKKSLAGTNIYVREDFSEKVLAKRKDLLPKMYEERKKGNVAYLRYDKLVVHPERNLRNRNMDPGTPLPQANSFGGRGRGIGRGSPPFNTSQ